MQWFRLHTKLLNDPVVQALDGDEFKTYINLLCYAASIDKGGYLGTINDVSFALRETKDNVTSRFIAFQGVGLISKNVTVDETFQIPQWSKLQYKSDTSSARVKKHRAKVKQAGNVTVTPPDTEQNRTDTEQKPPKSASRFTPPELQELMEYFVAKQSTTQEAERFYNYYESNGWKVGKNKMKKWQSAATGWITRSNQNKPKDSPDQTDFI